MYLYPMKIHFPLFLTTILLIGLSGCDNCRDVQCLNGGECVDGRCDCAYGYTGDDCSVDDLCAQNRVRCVNGGLCVNGICECPEGFSGSACEIRTVCEEGGQDCLNGGTCADGTCDCTAWFEGALCESKRINRYIFNGETGLIGAWNCGGGDFDSNYVDIYAAESHNELFLVEYGFGVSYFIRFESPDTNAFIIPSQNFGEGDTAYTVSGSGIFWKADSLQLFTRYDSINTGGFLECEFNSKNYGPNKWHGGSIPRATVSLRD